MNSSQHLLVLMSIILGLELRELLVGGRAAAVCSPWRELKILPFLAGLLVLIAIIQFWWYLLIIAHREIWSGNFFLVAAAIIRPMLLFVSAASVFPVAEGDADGELHYYRNRALIYSPLADAH